MQLTSLSLALTRAGFLSFSPASLFAANEPGVWYDPSDFSTMFQDAAGTTPVTAVEQPVGRILDKSGRGNHATQVTATSRPVLSARVNLLTRTEQFDDGVWVKTGVTVTPNAAAAPDGTLSADLVTGGGNWFAQVSAIAGYANQQLTGSLWVYPPAGVTSLTIRIDRSGIAQGNQVVKTVTPQTWQRVTHTATLDANTASPVLRVDLTNGASLTVWGASLVPADQASLPYQRVNTSTDYDAVGFPKYLKFDGVDDFLVTNSIDFSATDKMTVVAGVRKLQNTRSAVVDLSSAPFTNIGSFGIEIPNDTAGARGYFLCGSTLGQFYTAASSAPITEVLTTAYDIAATTYQTEIIPRSNGVALLPTSGAIAGTGNFGNYPLYIGRRAGTTLPFNGQIYSLIVRGAQTSTTQIAQTERWVAGKTGITL